MQDLHIAFLKLKHLVSPGFITPSCVTQPGAARTEGQDGNRMYQPLFWMCDGWWAESEAAALQADRG